MGTTLDGITIMKITGPLHSTHATGRLGAIGYFSGALGKTRLTAYPTLPRRAPAAANPQLTRLAPALAHWRNYPPNRLTKWNIIASKLMRTVQPRSAAFTGPRLAHISSPLTIAVQNLLAFTY